MRIIKRFSWHKQSGDFAESFLRKNFFSSLGLKFRKIRRDKKGKKPDGWILQDKQKIALSEIKLIKYSEKSDLTRVHRVTIDRTIQRALAKAREQKKRINKKHPKKIFLIFYDDFSEF